MKKHLILSSLLLIPFLASCDTSRVNTPNSPFKDDKYVRIGMRSKGDQEHKIAVNMSNQEYSELKTYINNIDHDGIEPEAKMSYQEVVWSWPE